MSIAIDQKTQNFVPAMPPVYIPSHGRYEWQKLRSWTGSPDYVRWFDAKPEDELDSMISFSMAIEDDQTMETSWFSVSAYGEDAETLKQYLIDEATPIFMKVEGTVKENNGYRNIQAKKLVVYANSLNRAEATPEVQAAHNANQPPEGHPATEPVAEFSNSPADYAEMENAPF